MNEDDIRQIQEEYEVTLTGVPKAVNIIELAKRYGVSQQTIRKIAKGQYKKKVNTK
jgi:DNA-binding XRE family transcriptional regulator